MAEEKKEESGDGAFYLGGEKITRDYVGNEKVVRGWDKRRGELPSSIGGEAIGRNAKGEATSWGDKDIKRNPATGDITSVGGKSVHWKEAGNLRRFLDGK